MSDQAQVLQNPLREGLIGERVPLPCTMVIFGASGDLTKRKLVPALYSLARDRLLPAPPWALSKTELSMAYVPTALWAPPPNYCPRRRRQ